LAFQSATGDAINVGNIGDIEATLSTNRGNRQIIRVRLLKENFNP
jgi:hypothetical protein